MRYALLFGASHGHLGYLYITDTHYLSQAAYYYFLNFKATKTRFLYTVICMSCILKFSFYFLNRMSCKV